jgi:hypothetical protein
VVLKLGGWANNPSRQKINLLRNINLNLGPGRIHSINDLSDMVGKPEGKRPLGRPRRRRVNNIKMDLVEVGWGDVDWIGLAQDRDRWGALVNSVLNLWVP